MVMGQGRFTHLACIGGGGKRIKHTGTEKEERFGRAKRG